MSGMYGSADRAESIATIHAALDAGITLLDTGDFYGMGHNELLIADALEGRNRDGRRDQRQVRRPARAGRRAGSVTTRGRRRSRPRSPTRCSGCGTDHIDIYRPARLDANVPIEETVGAIAELVQAGYVRHIGLSEVGAETIRRAAAVHPIADLQIEYSLISRGIEARDPADLPRARDRDHRLRSALARPDQRPLPRRRGDPGAATSAGACRAFQGENLRHNLALVEALREVADAKGVTRRADRVRLGPVARRGHRAARRRPAARPAGRGARRTRRRAGPRRPRADRARRSRPTRRPATATARRRWPTSTASAAISSR